VELGSRGLVVVRQLPHTETHVETTFGELSRLAALFASRLALRIGPSRTVLISRARSVTAAVATMATIGS
jgi:hypothetical protein